ncbi:MAG: hypothetical protein AAB731_03220 [Patescibacteria group bacterium]
MMDEKNQKYIIYGGVALAMAVIIGFWVANLDFILHGGFGKSVAVDDSWEKIKAAMSESADSVKRAVDGVKKEIGVEQPDAKVIELIKNKLESGLVNVTSTTSTAK